MRDNDGKKKRRFNQTEKEQNEQSKKGMHKVIFQNTLLCRSYARLRAFCNILLCGCREQNENDWIWCEGKFGGYKTAGRRIYIQILLDNRQLQS